MKNRALLIGVQDYLSPITNVTSAKNDLEALKYKLNQLTFDVEVIFNCTYDDIQCSITKFLNSAPCDSINVIYFTGHGFHYKGVNYLAPSDFEIGKSIKNNGYKIDNIINQSHKKITKIIIIDACRNNFANSYSGDFTATFSLPQDTYIAYATKFGAVASYTRFGLSYFTESICNNILAPNLSVNELFEVVRYELNMKGYPQISNCMSGLRKRTVLNKKVATNKIEQDIYNYIEENGNKYEKTSGYVAGEYEIFIDASQKFEIPLLDVYYKYSKIQSQKYHTDILSEAENKLNTFFIMKNSEYFSMGSNHTWFYKERKIRMGEILPLPKSMEQLKPVECKDIVVNVGCEIKNKLLIVSTNLPNGFILYLNTDKAKSFISGEVNDNKCIFQIEENTSKIIISSPITSIMENLDKNIVGEKGRNLVGNLVKFDPIFGNKISWFKDIK